MLRLTASELTGGIVLAGGERPASLLHARSSVAGGQLDETLGWASEGWTVELAQHPWADRFDGPLEDVFDPQDQVATSVAGVIEPTLQFVEFSRAASRDDRSNGA